MPGLSNTGALPPMSYSQNSGRSARLTTPSETDWKKRNGPRAVPIIARRMHRVFWVPPEYRTIIAVGLQGRFTMRDLARRAGYSLTGAWHATRAINKMGFASTKSVRGCKGYSKMTVQTDVDANVSTTEARSSSSLPRRVD